MSLWCFCLHRWFLLSCGAFRPADNRSKTLLGVRLRARPQLREHSDQEGNKSFPSSEVAHVPSGDQMDLATPLRLIFAYLLLPHAYSKQMGTRMWVWFPYAHGLPPALPPPESAGVPEGMMERGVFS